MTHVSSVASLVLPPRAGSDEVSPARLPALTEKAAGSTIATFKATSSPSSPPSLLPRLSGPSDLSAAEARLLDFDNVEHLAALFDSLSWTLDEEIALYIDVIRCAGNPNVRLRALKQLREARLEAMKLAGVIGEVKAKRTSRDEQGNRLTQTVVAQLIKRGGPLDVVPRPQPQFQSIPSTFGPDERSPDDGDRRHGETAESQEENQAAGVREGSESGTGKPTSIPGLAGPGSSSE